MPIEQANRGRGLDPTAGDNNYNNQGETISPIQSQFNIDTDIAVAEAEAGYGLEIKGVLDGLPVAEKNQEYFAVIKEVGDTSPELIDQSQFKITYICDSQLNVSKPSTDSVSLLNVTQNFERQKNAVVRVDEGTVLNQQLGGIHEITAVGSIEPIAGTQIGTGPYSYVTTMSFIQEGQLGAAPGVQVATYYMWLNKSLGFQNLSFSARTSGNNPYDGGTWTKPAAQVEISSSNIPGTGFRPYFDVNMYPLTGSGTETDGQTGAGVKPSSIPSFIDSDLYKNRITITTSSVDGNTRVRLSGGIGILCSSCSVADVFLRTNNPNGNWSNFSTRDGIASSKPVFKLRAYKESAGGVKTLLAVDSKFMDLSAPTGLTTAGLTAISDGSDPPNTGLDNFYDIWRPRDL